MNAGRFLVKFAYENTTYRYHTNYDINKVSLPSVCFITTLSHFMVHKLWCMTVAMINNETNCVIYPHHIWLPTICRYPPCYVGDPEVWGNNHTTSNLVHACPWGVCLATTGKAIYYSTLNLIVKFYIIIQKRERGTFNLSFVSGGCDFIELLKYIRLCV